MLELQRHPEASAACTAPMGGSCVRSSNAVADQATPYLAGEVAMSSTCGGGDGRGVGAGLLGGVAADVAVVCVGRSRGLLRGTEEATLGRQLWGGGSRKDTLDRRL